MYRPTQPDLVNAMSPALRARTILAAAGPAPWQIDDTEVVVAPFFELDGCPVLLLEPEYTSALLVAGRVRARLDLLPALGQVLLSGYVVPAGDEYAESAAHYRAEHAHCDAICGTDDRDLLRVVVDRVRITAPDGDAFAPVDVETYRATAPDDLLVECLAIAEHLNQDHGGELITLGSRLAEVPEQSVAAVTVDWIDAVGLDLSVIDVHGAQSVHADFHHRLTSARVLGAELHHMVLNPLSRLRVRPHREAQ